MVDAWNQVDAWLGSGAAWVPTPTERHAGILARLLAAPGVHGNLVPDAHLAALAIEHGLELNSTDGDFARFVGLTRNSPPSGVPAAMKLGTGIRPETLNQAREGWRRFRQAEPRKSQPAAVVADRAPVCGEGSPEATGRSRMDTMASDRSYDGDLALWAQDQARALRSAAQARINLPIDWENVAEEIESLGRSQGRELASRIGVIVVHLMKLQASPATEPRAGWRETIIEQRNEIRRLIEDSPSLRQTLDSVIAREISSAAYQASTAILDHGETPLIDLDSVCYSADQVLGNWFPG